MPKRKESLATLALLENEKPATTVDTTEVIKEEEDDAIQAPKYEKEEPIKKPRKPKSQKQLDAFAITRQKGIDANQARKQASQEKLNEKKMEKEERIVKTAIVIKRKQIKRESILDNVSDGEDDIPPPPKIKKTVSIKEPEKPPAHQFIFV